MKYMNVTKIISILQTFRRQYSNIPIKKLDANTQLAKKWLDELTVDLIPNYSLVERFDRSSGPGGQNVNKVNTKCTLSLKNFSQCSFIPEKVRTELISGSFRYYKRASDTVVVQSDETRSRNENRNTCKKKLVEEIKKHCNFQNVTPDNKIKKWDNVHAKMNEKRMLLKKINSSKKKLRGKLQDY